MTIHLSRRVFKGLAMAFLTAVLTGLPARASDLQIFTEENKPLNFTDSGKTTGYATEIVQEIQKRIGTTEAIRVVPWAQGFKAAREEPNTMLYATMRIEEREAFFKWVGPLTIVKTSFYAKKGSNLKVSNLNEAKLVPSIGVPRAFYSQQFLMDEGFRNLDVSDNPPAMLKKFMEGKNPVIVSHEFTLPALLAKEGIPEGDVVPLFTFMEKGHYLAFSQKTPDDVVQKWQKALDDMKKDGTFAKIFNKWLPGKKMPK